VYEGGVRVAAGARWPGVLEAGSLSNQFISVWDVLPTLAAAVGIEVKNDEARYPLDGRNLWAELKGEAPEKFPEEYLVVGNNGVIAIFDQQWKLIKEREDGGGGNLMLFEIEKSPWEDEEVTELYPEVAADLSERIEEIIRDVVDQL